MLLLAGAILAASAHAAPTILVMGDSLSAEYGLARGKGWVALLEQRLKDKRLDYSVVNASISGETSSGGAARMADALARNKPAVVIIELGGNDGLRGLALPATRANFEAMIKASQQSGAKVLIAGMQLPPNYGPQYTREFAAMFGEVAISHKAALVPFLLQGVADRADADSLFQADRIHPRAEAHPTLLNNVWPRLLPLLG